jgi:hypothetical protein
LKSYYNSILKFSPKLFSYRILIANELISKNTITIPILDWINGEYKPSYYFGLKSTLIEFIILNKTILKSVWKSIREKKILTKIRKKYGNPISYSDTYICTYFNFSLLKTNQEFKDHYFPGLNEYLKEKNPTYLSFLFYLNFSKFKYIRNMSLLNKKQVRYLSEYDLLSALDFFKAYVSTVLYFLEVKLVSQTLLKTKYKTQVPLLNIYSSVEIYKRFCRYLFAFKFAKSNSTNASIYNWYENNTLDRSFLYGINTGDKKKIVKVYGLQLFLYTPEYYQYAIDPEESDLHPNILVVNGKKYLRNIPGIKSIVAPSLRYKYLFHRREDYKDKILILLSYSDEYSKDVLSLLGNNLSDFFNYKIMIKSHPAASDHLLKNFSSKIEITYESLESLLPSTALVFSTVSGSLIESVAYGVPTLEYIPPNKKVFINFLHDRGKGIIYEHVSNSTELQEKIHLLLNNFKNRKNEIDELSQYYRDEYFCEPTPEKMKEIFG